MTTDAWYISSVYQIGYLTPWLGVGIFFVTLTLIALMFAPISGVNALRRPLRFITRLRFAVVHLP